jgi:hypothetical protein
MTLAVHRQKQYSFIQSGKSVTGKLPPLRTFTELHEEFGVKRNVFSAALRDENAPKPIMVKKNASAGTNSWYNPIEVRKWWAGRQLEGIT